MSAWGPKHPGTPEPGRSQSPGRMLLRAPSISRRAARLASVLCTEPTLQAQRVQSRLLSVGRVLAELSQQLRKKRYGSQLSAASSCGVMSGVSPAPSTHIHVCAQAHTHGCIPFSYSFLESCISIHCPTFYPKTLGSAAQQQKELGNRGFLCPQFHRLTEHPPHPGVTSFPSPHPLPF